MVEYVTVYVDPDQVSAQVSIANGPKVEGYHPETFAREALVEAVKLAIDGFTMGGSELTNEEDLPCLWPMTIDIKPDPGDNETVNITVTGKTENNRSIRVEFSEPRDKLAP